MIHWCKQEIWRKSATSLFNTSLLSSGPLSSQHNSCWDSWWRGERQSQIHKVMLLEQQTPTTLPWKRGLLCGESTSSDKGDLYLYLLNYLWLCWFSSTFMGTVTPPLDSFHDILLPSSTMTPLSVQSSGSEGLFIAISNLCVIVHPSISCYISHQYFLLVGVCCSQSV